MKIAQIFIDQKNKRLDRTFDYLVPDSAGPGMRTVQRFGGESRITRGFIVRIIEHSEYEKSLKEVRAVLDAEPVLTPLQIKLCLELKQSCFCLFWDALSFFTAWTPLRRSAGGLVPYAIKDVTWIAFEKEPERAGPVQEELLVLLRRHDWSYPELRKRMPNLRAPLKSLHDKGAVRKYTRRPAVLDPPAQIPEDYVYSEHLVPEAEGEEKPVFILAETDKELFSLIGSLITPERQLMIVSPSAEDAKRLADGFASCSGIVPEVYHGADPQEKRFAFARNFRDGRIKVASATAAGLFVPFGETPPAILVTDAASERYHLPGTLSLDTVKTAQRLSALSGAPLVLTDRLPSVLASYKTEEAGFEGGETDTAQTKWTDRTREFKRLFPLRPEELCLDEIHVIRMDSELRAGNTGILSGMLEASIGESLRNGERSVLLLNRKGYAGHLFCRSCGYSFHCPECGLPLQTDKSGRWLYCRDCGCRIERPDKCPACGSLRLRESGLGIEKAAALVEKRFRPDFPDVRVGIYPDDDADILIGTQKLLGAADFSNVGTAAALLIDFDISFPDYRAEERAYRLYSKFFRRVCENGRPERFIQTYLRDSEAVRAAAGAPARFLEQQAEYRRLMRLPPYGELFVFTLRTENVETARRESAILHDRIEGICEAEKTDAKVYPVFGLRNQSGACRFTVRSESPEFRDLLARLYADGEIEALVCSVSLNIDPPGIL